MADEIEKKTEEKEVVPAWATKLQETLEDLPNRLSEALTPQQQEQEEPEVTEIELPPVPQPQPPQQEEPQVIPQEDPQEEKPKSKKKSFLGWLL